MTWNRRIKCVWGGGRIGYNLDVPGVASMAIWGLLPRPAGRCWLHGGCWGGVHLLQLRCSQASKQTVAVLMAIKAAIAQVRAVITCRLMPQLRVVTVCWQRFCLGAECAVEPLPPCSAFPWQPGSDRGLLNQRSLLLLFTASGCPQGNVLVTASSSSQGGAAAKVQRQRRSQALYTLVFRKCHRPLLVASR